MPVKSVVFHQVLVLESGSIYFRRHIDFRVNFLEHVTIMYVVLVEDRVFLQIGTKVAAFNRVAMVFFVVVPLRYHFLKRLEVIRVLLNLLQLLVAQSFDFHQLLLVRIGDQFPASVVSFLRLGEGELVLILGKPLLVLEYRELRERVLGVDI